MTSERWNSFREMVSLREAVNSLLQESLVRPNNARPERGATTFTLPLDITEAENDFVVTASMPGIEPEDVQTSVLGNTSPIRAKTRSRTSRRAIDWLLASPCRIIPAIGNSRHAHQCGQGQCSVRERRFDPHLAEVGTSPPEADQYHRSVDSSRPGWHVDGHVDRSVPIWL